MTEFSAVTQKTVLDGTELVLGASSGDETVAQKFSRNTMNAQNGFINVRDYGALGEGYLGADDSVAILLARDAAVAQDRVLYFPPTPLTSGEVNLSGYRMTETLVVPTGISIVMDAGIIRTTEDTPVIQIGAVGVLGTSDNTIYKLQAAYTTGGNQLGTWVGRNNCCIEVLSLVDCPLFYVTKTNGGHTGLRFESSNQPMGWNNIQFGKLSNHKMGFETYLIGTAWFNQNRITGTAIICSSIIPPEDRWALYFHNDGLQDINRFNGNTFNGCGAALAVNSVAGKGVWAYGHNIGASQFHGMRMENTDPTYLIELDGNRSTPCRYNILNRNTDTTVANYFFDQKPDFDNDSMGIVEFTDVPNHWENVFDTGHLPDKITEHSGSTYTIEGMEFMGRLSNLITVNGPVDAVTADSITVNADSMPITKIFFENDDTRVLRIRSVSPGDQRFRIYFWAFNDAGDQMILEDAVRWCTHGGFIGTAAWGGARYATQADLGDEYESFVTFRGLNSAGFDAVRSVHIGFANLNVLSSWTVDRLSYTAARASSPNDLWKIPGKASDIIPTVASFVGDTVRNLAPSAGGVAGWVYTGTGWKTSGVIGA